MLEDLPTSADIGQKKIELDDQYPTDPVPALVDGEVNKPLATAAETVEGDIAQVVEEASRQSETALSNETDAENSEEMTDISQA